MRCRVIGPQPVLEKRRGEIVYLDDAHAARLIAAGHVEAAPAPPRRAPAPRKRRTVKTERAETQTSAAAEPDERTSESRTAPSPS